MNLLPMKFTKLPFVASSYGGGGFWKRKRYSKKKQHSSSGMRVAQYVPVSICTMQVTSYRHEAQVTGSYSNTGRPGPGTWVGLLRLAERNNIWKGVAASLAYDVVADV